MFLVQPIPEKKLSKLEYVRGGKYIRSDGIDVTDQTVSKAFINVSEGKALFYITDTLVEPSKEGPVIRVNLINAKVGWKWTENPHPTKILCTVETKSKHFYSLRVEFINGITLARYANSPTEPRLRPTTHGNIELCDFVGKVKIRNRIHAVYEKIIIK